MNTAYFGDGPSRRGSPVRFLVAALALAFLPVGAIAQTPPAESAPAVDVDTAIPGVTEEAAAPAPLTTTEEPAAEEGAEEAHNPFSIQGMWAQGDVVARSTLIIMIVMFSGTIYIAATKVIDQNILNGQVKKLGGFWRRARSTTVLRRSVRRARSETSPKARLLRRTARRRASELASVVVTGRPTRWA